jgi:hypothetical protein
MSRVFQVQTTGRFEVEDFAKQIHWADQHKLERSRALYKYVFRVCFLYVWVAKEGKARRLTY